MMLSDYWFYDKHDTKLMRSFATFAIQLKHTKNKSKKREKC